MPSPIQTAESKVLKPNKKLQAKARIKPTKRQVVKYNADKLERPRLEKAW